MLATGTDLSPEIVEPPILALPGGLNIQRRALDQESWYGDFEFTFQPDTTDLSLIRLYRTTEDVELLHTFAAGDRHSTVIVRYGTTEDFGEECFEVGQTDASGTEVLSEPLCVTPEVSGLLEPYGCSSSGRLRLGWLTLGLVALVPLRRRHPSLQNIASKDA